MTSSPNTNAGRHIILRLMIAVTGMRQVHSYVVGNPSNEGVLSRFADWQCALTLTVGRTPSTAMPPEWAASGAKLGLPLDVKFSTETCESYEMNQESLLGGAVPAFLAVNPLNSPTFTSANGIETVKVTPGAFSCQIKLPETEEYSFRFFLDFPEGAVRNDVVLPAERIYFMTSCWNGDSHVIEKAEVQKEQMVRSLKQINNDIDEMEHSPAGLQKALGVREYIVLMERRRKLVDQIGMLCDIFPPVDRLFKTPINMLFLKEGVIAVKRLQDNKETYHWVGTFTFR